MMEDKVANILVDFSEGKINFTEAMERMYSLLTLPLNSTDREYVWNHLKSFDANNNPLLRK